METNTTRVRVDETQVVKLYETMSMTKVGRALGINRNDIPAILRKNNAHIRTKKEWVGELGGHWKGGKTTGSSGNYIMLMRPNHPNATRHGYVMEHRLVMEKKMGRYLTPQEIVHHINGDGHDNRPENLEVISRSVHVHNHFAKGKHVMALEERIRKLEEEVARLKGGGDDEVQKGHSS